MRARRADMLAAAAAAAPAARAAGRLTRACQPEAKSDICYAFAHRIRPLGAAAQHQQERARGRRKWPASIAGMRAGGSEAEGRQAGLTERKVRDAL